MPSGENTAVYTKLICPASVSSGEPPLLPHTRVNLSSHVVTILVPSGDHITERSQFGCVYVCNKLPGVNIPPDETEVEATVSADVCTLTATDPAVAAPMVKPLMVTLNAAVVKAAPDVVMISAVAEGALPPPKRARARARGIAERGCVGVPLGVPLAEGGRTPKIRTKRGYRPDFFFHGGTYFTKLVHT